MPKKTIVDWENLPKDEPVEVFKAMLGYYVGLDNDRVMIKHHKERSEISRYSVRECAPLNKDYITVEEDWGSVKVDARVRCRDIGSSEWELAHFAEYRNQKVWVFPNGTTSWSKNRTHPLIPFDIAELMIDE